MKRLLQILLLLACNYCEAGSVDFIAAVYDSTTHNPIANATCIVVNSKDSSIANYGLTDASGKFTISGLASGDYYITVSHINYINFSRSFHYSGDSSIQMKIGLLQKALMLANIIIGNNQHGIIYKKDTVEYIADSFLVSKSANVEDLLRHLPGFSINKDGDIAVNGRAVEKMMIDGDEYFSYDQTLVTQTLKAAIIDRVQLFDKKSDKAAFTKIDDNNSARTLNLTLKKDKNKGIFGLLSAGKAISGYHNHKLVVNHFNGKQKMAVFGILSSTGKTGLSWREQTKYSNHALSALESSGLYGKQPLPLDIWNGAYNKQGLPKSVVAGFHFNDTWNKNTHQSKFNIDYSYNELGLYTKNNTLSRYIQNNSIFKKNNSHVADNQRKAHALILDYSYTFNSHSDISIGFESRFEMKKIKNHFVSELRNQNGKLMNNQKRQISPQGTNNFFNGSIKYRNRFKNGNSLVLESKANTVARDFSGNVYSEDSLFGGSGFLELDRTNQMKDEQSNSMALASRIDYIMKLNKQSNLGIYAVLAGNLGGSSFYSFNEEGGSYQRMDSAFSSCFKSKTLTTYAGISYNLKIRKTKFNASVDVGKTHTRLSDKYHNLKSNRDNNYFGYTIFSETDFRMMHKLIIGVEGKTILPNIRQLQSVAINTDPLNINIGNPFLKPTFSNNYYVQYYNFSLLNRLNSFSFGGFFNQYFNGIGTKDSISSSGKRTFQYVNMPGIHNFMFFTNATKSIIGNVFLVNMGLQWSRYRDKRFINSKKAVTLGNTYTFSITPKVFFSEKLELSSLAGIRFQGFNSAGIKKKSHNFYLAPRIEIPISKIATLTSDYYWLHYNKNETFGSEEDISELNIGLEYQAFNNLKISAECKDVFDSNNGVSRQSTGQYFHQKKYNTLPRYFLLTISYHFSKIFKK